MIATQFLNLDKAAAKGLCMEFILHEYAKTLAIASRLENDSPPHLLSDLEKLTADQGGCQFAQPGALDKLCFYCEVLVQTTKTGEKLLDAIEDLRARLTIQRAKLARHLSFDADTHLPSPELLQEMAAQVRGWFTLIASLLPSFADCETALFALLEQREAINRHLGCAAVEEVLVRLFPSGLEQLRHAIVRGFERRGFGDYFNRHQALLEGLTWPSESKR